MSNCINYNCDDAIGTHLPNECGIERQGGASAILLIECGSGLADPSDATEITDLIESGQATLITQVGVNYDIASPIEVDSAIPCRPSRVTNYDRSLNVIDENVNANNVTMWDSVSGRTFGAAVIFECGNTEDPKVKYIEAAITATVGDTLPATDGEFQKFQAILKWKSKTMPSIHNFPVGVV